MQRLIIIMFYLEFVNLINVKSMKAIVSFSVVVLLFVCVGCNSNKKEADQTSDQAASVSADSVPTPVPYKELSGYFLRNTSELPAEVNLIVAQNPDQMSLDFGMAKTMNNKVDTVDFTIDDVVGVASQPTDHKTEIKIEKVEKVGKTLKVYALIVQEEKLSYKIQPLVIFSFPKDSGVDQVELYSGTEKKDSKPYKI